MSAVLPATELVPLPTTGRRFVAEQAVRLGDVDPSGRLRLDAAARLLQDVANDDALDAELENSFGWVVRRTLIDVRRAPQLGERLRLTTFCSGTGRSWAERRTSVEGDGGGRVEATALWVQVDPTTGRPAGLGDGFERIYGEAGGGRRVSTRLTLPAPPTDAARRPWTVRQVDLDVLAHVNNAVAWGVVHEVLGPGGVAEGVGEIEYLAPIGTEDAPLELRASAGDDGTGVWITTGDVVRVAARWSPA